jgi:hypothetical protein
VWEASDTFSVRGGHVRIRSNTPEVAAIVRSLLADRLVDDEIGGAFAYSVRIEPESTVRGAAQAMHVLYEDCSVVRRSRSPERVLQNLVAHVEGRDSLGEPGPLRLAGCAVVGVRGCAVLPLALEADLVRVERRLNAAGLQVVDAPYLTFDSRTGELLVPAPVAIDPALLHGLDVYAAPEPGAAPAGRHRVAGWMLDELRGADDRRRPALALVLNQDALTPERARRLVAKIQDGATLVARWYPWPTDLVPPIVRLAEGRR